MKYLILCEGTNEQTIIDMLLDSNKLIFSRDELLSLKPFHARQLTHPALLFELRTYHGPVQIIRIGDKQNEKFEIPDEFKNIITSKQIFKYCTLPELEILLIINEGLYKKFLNSKEKAKSFAKQNIIYNGMRYNQSSDFLIKYYGGKRINTLVDNIKEYKHLKRHRKDQLYLADLLKNNNT